MLVLKKIGSVKVKNGLFQDRLGKKFVSERKIVYILISIKIHKISTRISI